VVGGAFVIVLVLERCGGVMLSLTGSVGLIDFCDLTGITFACFFWTFGLRVFGVLIRDIIAVANLVRKEGFEPSRLAAPPPQDGASASSATSAWRGEKRIVSDAAISEEASERAACLAMAPAFVLMVAASNLPGRWPEELPALLA
jgi:hypothetical protein